MAAGLAPIVRGRCTLCGFSRNLFVTELAGRVTCDHVDRGCPGDLVVVYKGLKANIPAELHNVRCTCQEPAVSVRVISLGGDTWDVGAERQWPVAAVKGKLELLSGVPRREQRLISGFAPLRDCQLLEELLPAPAASEGRAVSCIDVTLVRRSPAQADWLERVEENAAALREAPADACADPEVVLVALRQNPALLYCAADSLLEERDFVLSAVRERGGPEPPRLQDARDEALGWLRSPADAKLALRAAWHLRAPGLAAAVARHPVTAKAREEERVHLAVEPANTPESARELVREMPRDAARLALRPPALENLALGIQLLDSHSGAPDRGVMGKMARAVFGGKPAASMPEFRGILEPGDFAKALFSRHSDELRADADSFAKLLVHLEETVKSLEVETCCSLVGVCICHGHREQAGKFFILGADISDPCVMLLAAGGLPVAALLGHPEKELLLARMLEGVDGPDQVLEAVAVDGGPLRELLRAVEVDSRATELCARQEFREALALAANRGEEATGRVLFRALSVARPQELPGFPVPLPWLSSLRGVERCSWLAAELLLLSLEGAANTELGRMTAECWGLVDWQACSASQLQRAIEVLRRRGVAGETEEGGDGPEGRRGRLEVQAQLSQALSSLPLGRLEDPMVCAAPGLPPHALAMVALGRAEIAEKRAGEAEDRARRAEQRATRLEASLEEVRREMHSMERRLKSEMNQR